MCLWNQQVHRLWSKKLTNLGFKTLIKPSAEKFKAHLRKLREIVDKHKTESQLVLINQRKPNYCC